MSTFKKCKVVMLPTNKKAQLVLGQKLANVGKTNIDNDEDITKQHLYITSDEKIKEGDWCYSEEGDSIFQIKEFQLPTSKYCKKIIATTDRLSILVPHYEAEILEYVPQPSQAFIEKYIKEYNKGNIITDVLVEYERKTNSSLGYNQYCYLTQKNIALNTIGNFIEGNKYQFDDYEIEEYLKINPKDNTITIKKVKDSWNRKEIVEKLYLMSEYMKSRSTLSEISFNKWIEENL